MAGMAALDRAHGISRARDRRLGDVGGMCVADRLVLDRAQPEALVGVVGCLLEAAVVVDQHFGLPVFEEQFAVVGTIEAAVDQLADAGTVEAGPVKQGSIRVHGRLQSGA
jgi:hypothetical protein